MARPKLPEDRRRVKVQTYLSPRLHQAACVLAEQRSVSVSQVVADLALEGAKVYRDKATSSRPPTPEDETDVPDGL